jgi:hypothetical protein
VNGNAYCTKACFRHVQRTFEKHWSSIGHQTKAHLHVFCVQQVCFIFPIHKLVILWISVSFELFCSFLSFI